MNVITIKVLGGIALWLSMVVFGLVPLFYTKFKTSKVFISLTNCFCGGLFITIGLVHILPESHEMLDMSHRAVRAPRKARLLQDSDGGGLQYSYLVCLMSYSLILFLDKVVFNNSDLIESNPHNHGASQKLDLNKSMINMSLRDSDSRDGGQLEDNFKERVSSKYKLALRMSRNSNLRDSLANDRLSDLHEHDVILQKPRLRVLKNSVYESQHESEKESEPKQEKLIFEDPKKANSEQQNKAPTRKQPLPAINEENRLLSLKPPQQFQSGDGHSRQRSHEHQNHAHNLVKKNDSVVTSIVLLIAMGIHGFFALLAFGIEPTRSGTGKLFLALITHKWSEAMTVGRGVWAANPQEYLSCRPGLTGKGRSG